MTVLSRSAIGSVLRDPITQGVYDRCVAEAVNVARAAKIQLPADILESVRTRSEHYLASAAQETTKSSLLSKPTPTEIDTLNRAAGITPAQMVVVPFVLRSRIASDRNRRRFERQHSPRRSECSTR
ncbi:ketopantoate reductase C-terminal domain-containing protein [Anatilimnocola floriformis]|uniref:ketopantoate reductase C-terminal domain-containing protein n=1 Tax=Anatilimnocola floriformis TaxID=2948575 RepID=UPI0036F2109C